MHESTSRPRDPFRRSRCASAGPLWICALPILAQPPAAPPDAPNGPPEPNAAAQFAVVPRGDHLTAYLDFAEQIYDFVDAH
jgi:hypothetical protein